MRFLPLSMTFALIAALFSTSASAQLPTEFSDTVINTTELRGYVYVLDGEGVNMIVAVADDGLLVIDTIFEPLYERIRTSISEISDLPVRYLVNTHHHRDHIEGNARFAADGAEIISHIDMIPLVREGSVSGLTGNRVPPAPEAAIPTITFGDEMTLEMEGLTAELKFPGVSHTNADTYVYFPKNDILVTGDIVTFERYPNIEFTYGGHIDLMIEATDAFIEMSDEDTIIVPGHGPVGDRQTLIAYRDMLATSRDRVKEMMNAGHTLDEIIASRPNADFDEAMDVVERRIENWIRVIYYSYKPPA